MFGFDTKMPFIPYTAINKIIIRRSGQSFRLPNNNSSYMFIISKEKRWMHHRKNFEAEWFIKITSIYWEPRHFSVLSDINFSVEVTFCWLSPSLSRWHMSKFWINGPDVVLMRRTHVPTNLVSPVWFLVLRAIARDSFFIERWCIRKLNLSTLIYRW